MRPIRFRAWDKKDSAMLPWETDYQVILDAIPSGAGDEWTERCEVMQFTGILDKNGKEIYEGDIVRVSDPPYWTEEREISDDDRKLWRGGTAQVVFRPFGFYMKEIDCGDWSFNDPEGQHWIESEIEIIGNIYENPELMKPEPEKGK